MTQEEYEAKVRSMPWQLRESFREALEIALSKRIVNRFMGVVMKAYADGQRAAQKDSHDGAYKHGAEDMLEAMKTISSMGYVDMQKYFPGDYTSDVSGMRKILLMNPGDILEAVDKYQNDQQMEKDECEKASVKAMADEIGIDKLLQLAGQIKSETADGLPF